MPKLLYWKRSWSCCLGPIILLSLDATEQVLAHEMGHYRQWRKMWLLYYILVGLPSIGRWVMCAIGWRDWDWYYTGWPEKQADQLGGVKR